MIVVRHKGAREFLDRAGAWLERAEVENNLILGIAQLFKADPGNLKNDPYFLIVEDDKGVAGAALMTPPHRLIITRMPQAAIVTLVGYLLSDQVPVPGVNGPNTEVNFFSKQWATKTGQQQRLKRNLRLYACDRVLTLSSNPGLFRPATKDDESLLIDWAGEFRREAGTEDEASHTKAQISTLTAKGWLYVWQDGEVVSMAELGRETSHGFSVSLVYTPLHFRNKGYATSCVAELPKRMLDSGKKFCCLYTDLANPTSNSIYQKIGYQPVCDVQDWIFG